MQQISRIILALLAVTKRVYLDELIMIEPDGVIQMFNNFKFG